MCVGDKEREREGASGSMCVTVQSSKRQLTSMGTKRGFLVLTKKRIRRGKVFLPFSLNLFFQQLFKTSWPHFHGNNFNFKI